MTIITLVDVQTANSARLSLNNKFARMFDAGKQLDDDDDDDVKETGLM